MSLAKAELESPSSARPRTVAVADILPPIRVKDVARLRPIHFRLQGDDRGRSRPKSLAAENRLDPPHRPEREEAGPGRIGGVPDPHPIGVRPELEDPFALPDPDPPPAARGLEVGSVDPPLHARGGEEGDESADPLRVELETSGTHRAEARSLTHDLHHRAVAL